MSVLWTSEHKTLYGNRTVEISYEGVCMQCACVCVCVGVEEKRIPEVTVMISRCEWLAELGSNMTRHAAPWNAYLLWTGRWRRRSLRCLYFMVKKPLRGNRASVEGRFSSEGFSELTKSPPPPTVRHVLSPRAKAWSHGGGRWKQAQETYGFVS